MLLRLLLLLLLAPAPAAAQHVVFVTGDEEYRSEESMPMLARILKRDYGFRVTVLYSLDERGVIDPNNVASIPGLAALTDADLMVMFTRFRALPDSQLRHIVEYAESGRPMVGFRTATHAFSYPDDSPHQDMNEDWPRRVFGQKWIVHHGHFDDGGRPLTAVEPVAVLLHAFLDPAGVERRVCQRRASCGRRIRRASGTHQPPARRSGLPPPRTAGRGGRRARAAPLRRRRLRFLPRRRR